jgi:opacity protein-like surface antigen
MKKFAIIALAAVALLQSALSAAADKPTDSRPKPSSFVPHPHSNNHVYGAPIHPAILGHSRTSHYKVTPKKQSLSPTRK